MGLDERWIYLGPIKLPSALLALLPINVMDWLPNNLPVDLLNAGKNAMVQVLLAERTTEKLMMTA